MARGVGQATGLSNLTAHALAGAASRLPLGRQARADLSAPNLPKDKGGSRDKRGWGLGETDVVIIGAGLAGLVAACEAAARGKRVLMLDQEPRQSLGGQAFWSLGGLFMVDTPEQRRLRVRDSMDLARQDWLGSAGFDRAEDKWPRAWAEAYLGFAAGEMRPWLHGRGMRWFPVVGWPERGGSLADGHGNSVPRFHVT